ncbi:MAG: hypothetical protein AB7L76_19670 [Burkholderiaceae bacterium]
MMVTNKAGFIDKTAFIAAAALAAALLAAGALPAPAQAQAPSQWQVQSTPLRKPAAVAAAKAVDGAFVQWYDGTQRRQWRVDPAYVADFAGRDAAVRGPQSLLKRSLGGEKALETLPAGQSPVFRDETGNARALPGGIIVKLAADQAPRARTLLSSAGLTPVRALSPDGSLWLAESPAGMPSLQLANQLHESGRFEWAAPNWWRERVRK